MDSKSAGKAVCNSCESGYFVDENKNCIKNDSKI